jgi:Pyruvate/2-oxoacid:ferredoxin oxidoreductase delta subunit
MTQGISELPKPLFRRIGTGSVPAAQSRPVIKKIPTELRKPRTAFRREGRWWRRLAGRLRDDSQFLRSAIQLAFALLCLWIGLEFHLFMKWGLSGGQAAFVARPPGAEGFLPISALITAKYWLQTGSISMVHPAALFILIAIIGVSVVVKKAFCSWLCPVGTLSESLWMLGKKIAGRTFAVPPWLDYPLRSLKYLLLVFFGYAIWNMDVEGLRNFIYSPYNKMADIKMYLFFAEISTFALGAIVALMLLSVFIRNFWCRFLCPYGALLGIAGWLSPLKITRTASTCIDCELCTKACPSNINVHKAGRVWNDECTSCLACVQACPVRDTLEMRARKQGPAVPSWVVGGLIAGVFVAVTGLAMLAGTWQNGIGREEYRRRFGELDRPIYQHFRGEVPAYGPQD